MQIILSFLVIMGLLVSPVDNRTNPGVNQISTAPYNSGYIGVAHNYLIGKTFYELEVGDTVLVMEDQLSTYIVASKGIYKFHGYPTIDGNYDHIFDLSSTGSIILLTCWPEIGHTEGQLIVKLIPIKEERVTYGRFYK